MNIYIDESGVFRNPQNKPHLASVIAALVIPSSQRPKVIRESFRVTQGWKPEGEEIKGRELNEDQIAEIVSFLRKYDVCLDARIIDLGMHSEDQVTEYKMDLAAKYTKNLKPDNHPNLISQITGIQQAFIRMPNPLFIQAMLLVFLLPHLITKMCHYYARRIPKELGTFRWLIDAKDKNRTEYENAWSLAVYPAMANYSTRNPFTMIKGGDYSYLEKFVTDDTEAIRQIRQRADFDSTDPRNKDIASVKLKKILGRSFNFDDSRNNRGLQLADILANAIQRALNGKLQRRGWEDIGCLMIDYIPSSADMVLLTTDRTAKKPLPKNSPFFEVLDHFKGKAKSMWTAQDRKKFKSLR